jgi:hypothetical protein
MAAPKQPERTTTQLLESVAASAAALATKTIFRLDRNANMLEYEESVNTLITSHLYAPKSIAQLLTTEHGLKLPTGEQVTVRELLGPRTREWLSAATSAPPSDASI